MRNLFLSLLFIELLGQPSVQAEEHSSIAELNLNQAIDMATAQSEDLKIAAENKVQSEARRKQALGGILPDVHWLWNRLYQEQAASSGPLNGQERTDSRFTASQPLFKGFKEFAGISAAKAQTRQYEAELQRSTVLLALDVAQVFYQVIRLETNTRDVETLIKLTSDRVKDLGGRVRLGKTRNSEVVSAESQFAQLNATRESYLGEIISQRDSLGFYVGQDVRSTVLIDSITIPSPLPSEDYFLNLAPKRSDLVALQENAMAYRYAVRVAKSGYYPFLNLLGNYYTQRTGFQSDIDWDLALNLDVPIFQGGTITGQVREAESQLRQAELQLNRQRRFANSEIRQAYAVLVSSIRQVEAYQQSAKKSRASYDAQMRDYRLGLVNNLDVLSSLNVLQDTDANYNTAVVQSKLNYLKLKYVTEDLQ